MSWFWAPFISIGVMIIMGLIEKNWSGSTASYADFDYTLASYGRPARFSRESGIFAVKFLKPGRRPVEGNMKNIPISPKAWKWLPIMNVQARWPSFITNQNRVHTMTVKSYEQLISELKTLGSLSRLVELDNDTAILLVGRSVVPIVKLDYDGRYKNTGFELDDALCTAYNRSDHELIVESPVIIDPEAEKIKNNGNVKLLGLKDGVIITPEEALVNIMALQRSQEWRDLKVSNQECRQEAFEESVKKLGKFMDSRSVSSKTV